MSVNLDKINIKEIRELGGAIVKQAAADYQSSVRLDRNFKKDFGFTPEEAIIFWPDIKKRTKLNKKGKEVPYVYNRLKKCEKYRKYKAEAEVFLKSEWCYQLTGNHAGEKIIKLLKQEARGEYHSLEERIKIYKAVRRTSTAKTVKNMRDICKEFHTTERYAWACYDEFEFGKKDPNELFA